MQRYDIIIKNCAYLTAEYTIETEKTLCIDQGKIARITDSSTEVTGETVINGYGKLVMPGFTDGHTHVSQQLLRGRTLDEYPMIWARILIPFESNLEPDDVYWSTQLACLEMIKSGTTAFADAGGRHMNYAAEAALRSGLRANISRSTMDSGAFIPESMKESVDQNLKETVQRV